VQVLEALTEKSSQVQARGRELAHKFHILAEVVEGACNVYVSWDEEHVSIGGLLGTSLFRGDLYFKGKS
jgi:hypothetical protein